MATPTCVGRLPSGETCGRVMRFLREALMNRKQKAYVFQCPYCSAVRAMTSR